MSEEQQPHTVKATFSELVPTSWTSSENSWLWVTCYHSMLIPKRELEKGPKRIVLPDAVAIVFHGTPTYYPEPVLEALSTETPSFFTQLQGHRQGPEGTYLMLILPYNPPRENDYQARVRELTIRSLLSIVVGENIAYRRLFQNAVRTDNPEASFASPSVRAPNTLPAPDLSEERLQLVSKVREAIEVLGEHERNRIKLSLRWHGQAQGTKGIDEFINRWVALEALGMSDRNNIRPLEELLARAYSISLPQARRRFGVGRLFGFRSSILHHGKLPSLHADLLDYMKALYKDLLWERLGLPCESDSENMLNRSNFSLESLLAEVEI